MDKNVLIEWAKKDIATLERLASSDNRDPRCEISMVREEIEVMQKLIESAIMRGDYEELEERMRMEADQLGYLDAQEGLPCDASKTRVTATYFGLFVNDYYTGYKLGEATRDGRNLTNKGERYG